MTDTPRHQLFLELMGKFLDGNLAASSFCAKFTKLWMRDRDAARDAEQTKKAAWSQPHDELLLAAFQRGEMSGEDFRKEHAKLWGYADDVEFQTMIDVLHSACSCWRPSPEFEWEIGEEELRREVKEALASYQKLDKPLARTA